MGLTYFPEQKLGISFASELNGQKKQSRGKAGAPYTTYGGGRLRNSWIERYVMKNTIVSSIYFVAKMYLNELVTSLLWLETVPPTVKATTPVCKSLIKNNSCCEASADDA